MDPEQGLSHSVQVFSGRRWGAVQVELVESKAERPPVEIQRAEPAVERELERVREGRGASNQWLYFDRNLFVYGEDSTLIFKPQQRLWWTRSQALNDADEIIAAALAPEARA